MYQLVFIYDPVYWIIGRIKRNRFVPVHMCMLLCGNYIRLRHSGVFRQKVFIIIIFLTTPEMTIVRMYRFRRYRYNDLKKKK